MQIVTHLLKRRKEGSPRTQKTWMVILQIHVQTQLQRGKVEKGQRRSFGSSFWNFFRTKNTVQDLLNGQIGKKVNNHWILLGQRIKLIRLSSWFCLQVYLNWLTRKQFHVYGDCIKISQTWITKPWAERWGMLSHSSFKLDHFILQISPITYSKSTGTIINEVFWPKLMVSG